MNILSISDVITNSSSEVFCTIHHKDNEVLEEIYEALLHLMSSECYDEYYPSVQHNEGDLEVWMPYHLMDFEEFFRAGLEAILDKHFKDYTITYEE